MCIGGYSLFQVVFFGGVNESTNNAVCFVQTKVNWKIQLSLLYEAFRCVAFYVHDLCTMNTKFDYHSTNVCMLTPYVLVGL